MTLRYEHKRPPLPAMLAVAILLLTAAACTSAVAGDRPLVRSGLSGPVRAWTRAVEAGDLAAIIQMHDEDTIAFPTDAMVKKGARAIIAGYESMFAAYTVSVQITDPHYIETRDVVHTWGLYTLTLKPRNGGPDQVVRGRFSDIARRVNGGWRYIMDHASLSPSPP